MSYTPDDQLIADDLTAFLERLDRLRDVMLRRIRSDASTGGRWTDEHNKELSGFVARLTDLETDLRNSLRNER